ncbi:MAG: TrbG/VirB9 family P-type conjugative transfer protein [Acidobacteriota bacterium]
MQIRRVGLGFALVGALWAPLRAEQTGVREVSATGRTLISITSKVRFSTMIILPEGEEIMDVVCGDKEFWVINAARNIAHVKPAKEGAATNLNLVTVSGAVYSFLLNENGKVPTDIQVVVTADVDHVPTPAQFVPVQEVVDMRTALREMRNSLDAVAHQSEPHTAEVIHNYPAAMKFSYRVPAYKKPFLISTIWHDDTHTYIKSDARELPALYQLIDGGDPQLVNFTVENGTYIVPKILERGYFALGKETLEFSSTDH